MDKSKNLRYLLGVTCFTAILDVFYNTFLISRFYNLSGGDANKVISIYYIIVYATIPFISLIFRRYFKAKSTEAMRSGVIINALLMILISAMNDQMLISVYGIIGFLFGVSQAFYYVPYSVVVATFAGKNSIRYCATSNMIFNIANIVFPITLGKIIDANSFRSVAIALTVLAILQVVLTFKVENIRNRVEFNFHEFFKLIKNNIEERKKVENTAKITFYKGVNTSVLDRTVLLLIKSMFETEFELGRLTTIFAIITILVNYLAQKIFRKKNGENISSKQFSYMKIILIFSMISVTSAIMYLIVMPSKNSFVIFRLISSIFITIILLLTDMNHYDVSSETGNFKAEFQIFTEFCLGLGKVGGMAVLLIVDYIIGSIFAIDAVLIVIASIVIMHARTLLKNFSKAID